MRRFHTPVVAEGILLAVDGEDVWQCAELIVGEFHTVSVTKMRIVSPVADEVNAVASQVRASDARRRQERARRGYSRADHH